MAARTCFLFTVTLCIACSSTIRAAVIDPDLGDQFGERGLRRFGQRSDATDQRRRPFGCRADLVATSQRRPVSQWDRLGTAVGHQLRRVACSPRHASITFNLGAVIQLVLSTSGTMWRTPAGD